MPYTHFTRQNVGSSRTVKCEITRQCVRMLCFGLNRGVSRGLFSNVIDRLACNAQVLHLDEIEISAGMNGDFRVSMSKIDG